ncbi:MAG: hypothetical protein IKT38_01785 [Clostridia bacterium]|nr:hypothetical protein [Clostridia bacterium]
MKFAYELEKLCKVCMNHFEELCEKGKDKIYVFSIELDSQSIWGGNGDRDTDKFFYITPNGWREETITKEYGMYQKGNGIIAQDFCCTTSKSIENDINGDKSKRFNIEQLFKFYDKIQKRFPDEFI